MDTTITFHITEEDKKRLKEIAKQQRLSLSSYCRSSLVKKIKQEEIIAQ